ncbi:MAG: hypothetical protein KIT11_07220 [Fimbriimonadaceae bacterium]|nr:hypothetical protein [Fimbriimonadaceae bacterium]QYK56142.1 MAG: hypothetical protein KF733_01410 [Fimbriimonadaceae bacterium]
MYDRHERGFDLMTFLFGAAVGVAATMMYATYRRQEFEQAVDRAQEMTERGADRVREIASKGQAVVDQVAERAKDKIDMTREHVKGAVSTVETRAEQLARKAADGREISAS